MVGTTAQGSVPVDCKLMIKFRDSDKNFMGIQVQTTLNSVQGTKYPYTYCVLIAKPEFGIREKIKQFIETPPPGGFSVGLFGDSNAKKEAKFARYRGCVIESKTEKDVQIVVVRQNTSGTGYRTSPEQAAVVFGAAHSLAVRVLQTR